MSREKTNKSLFPVFSDNINALIVDKCRGDKKLFAGTVGVAYDTVRRWCNGENLPDGKDLLSVHNKFDVSIDGLITGKNPGESFMCDWSDDMKETCKTVKKILESEDKETSDALRSSILAFEKSFARFKDNKGLRKDAESRKREIRHIKKLNNPESLTGTD